jgi:hypothetical protein
LKRYAEFTVVTVPAISVAAYGHDDLLHMYENDVYLVYCTLLVLLVGVLYCVYR